jgi:hypothetical protein
MEVFVNERKVKINTEVGRWASLGGLVVLVVGMIVSIRNPGLVWASMASLLVGFLASIVGAYYANHWTRTPRPDQVLSQSLKGISNRYHLYHYLLPVAHVLLGPAGLFVIRAYLHEGPVIYDGNKWKQKQSLLRRLGFSGQDSLSDPVRDTMVDVQRFQAWLSKRMPPDEIPEVTPVIVFVRDGVELDLAETPIPVLRYKQLKGHVRRIGKESAAPLDDDLLYAIERAILGDKIDEL